MRKMVAFLLIFGAVGSFLFAQRDEDFLRGIIYYLLNDKEMAKQSLGTYFHEYPQTEIRTGFNLLLENKSWEAAKQFSKFLEGYSRVRNHQALVGVALSLSEMGANTMIDNLNKALRISNNYVPALVCLANIFITERNYPEAEQILAKALKYSTIAETKLMMGKYFLESGQPKKAFDLLRVDADALPQSFHLNLMAAQAALVLGQLDAVNQYVERSLRIKSQSPEALLVQGQVLIRQGEWKRARTMLEKLRFEYFNAGYAIAMAEALVQLDDANAERYLYEAFSQNKWHPKVNRLFAVQFARRKKGNVQNWIHRALLSGVSREELQKSLGSEYQYPQQANMPFFEINKICWLDASTLALGGRSKSGESESLYLVSINPLTVLKSFPYQGSIQDFFVSPARDKLVFSTSVADNQKVNLYYLQNIPKRYTLKTLSPSPFPFSAVSGAYSGDGNAFYFTDSGFPLLAFESPFSQVGGMGQRVLVYPQFPFRLYAYTFASGALATVRELPRLRNIPMPDLKKYLLVADAFIGNQDVENQIRKGQNLELTSSDYEKIHFSDDLNALLVFYADLENAFRAIIFHADQNRAYRVDETMFLGKKKYAELVVLKLDSKKKDIYVLTKDKDRELIRFNYGSLLYDKIAGSVLEFFSTSNSNRIYILSEKKRNLYNTDTLLEVISSSPYSREKISARNDIQKIVGNGSGEGSVIFSTYNGEIVKMDEEKRFQTVQVSLEGAPSGISPDGKQAAAFINGRLFLLKWGA